MTSTDTKSSSFSIPTVNFSSKVDSLSNFAELSLQSDSNASSVDNLKDFAKLQLGDDTKKGKPLNIPNIFNKKPLEVELETTEFKIDLKSALETTKVRPKEPKKPSKKEPIIFIPQFVDCENFAPTFALSEEDESKLLSLVQLRDRLKFVNVSKFSSVGRVIKKKVILKRPCNVKHTFVPKNVLKAFNFEVLSPDDLILRHLNKKKN